MKRARVDPSPDNGSGAFVRAMAEIPGPEQAEVQAMDLAQKRGACVRDFSAQWYWLSSVKGPALAPSPLQFTPQGDFCRASPTYVQSMAHGAH